MGVAWLAQRVDGNFDIFARHYTGGKLADVEKLSDSKGNDLCAVAATAAVLTFMGQWNAFLHPFIFLNTKSKYTLAVGIRYFQSVAGFTDDVEPKFHLLMAGSVMMTLPVIILFFVAQRYLVQGIVMSGIKG